MQCPNCGALLKVSICPEQPAPVLRDTGRMLRSYDPVVRVEAANAILNDPESTPEQRVEAVTVLSALKEVAA